MRNSYIYIYIYADPPRYLPFPAHELKSAQIAASTPPIAHISRVVLQSALRFHMSADNPQVLRLATESKPQAWIGTVISQINDV